MEEYTRLLKKVNAYFELDDIEMSQEYISAYDLYTILNDKLDQLRKVTLGEELQRKINIDNTVKKTSGKLFCKKTELELEQECKNISASTKGNKAELIFFLGSSGQKAATKHIALYRDFGTDEIYFGKWYQDRDFVMKYYKEITSYFDTLEEFANLLGFDINQFGQIDCTQIFSDSFMKLVLKYDNKGKLTDNISIVKIEDPDDIYSREWLKQKSIARFVDERKNEILKKIPIKVKNLNQPCKNIIAPYLVRGKVLQKTNN